MFCSKKLLELSACVDLRRTTSRHALQIRPSDRPRSANHPPAAGAAYPHADPELFAQGDADQSFRELAAGPAGQLAGALCLPGKGDRAEDRGRFHGADDGDQSVRFLRRALRRQLSVRLHRRPQDRTRALSRDHRARTAVFKTPGRNSARSGEHGQFPGRSQRATAKENSLHHSHGAGRPDAGRDAGRRRRIVPRFRVAVDPDLAASRARRPFRLRLSHPAASRHRSGRGTARGRERFHRSARLGRGLSSRRGLDRVRRHLGHADRRGAHPGRRHAALPHGGADLRRGRIRQCRIQFRDERQAASARRRASQSRSPTTPGRGSTGSANRSMPISRHRTCA